MNEALLEELTVALNRELYAEEAGLPVDHANLEARALALAEEYRRALAGAPDAAQRDMALDGLAEAESAAWDVQVVQAMDSALVVPDILVEGRPVTWRTWKEAEREIADPALRLALFEAMIERSRAIAPVLEARYAARRALYATHGTTPLEVFARREGLTAPALRRLAERVGDACRAPFRAALDEMTCEVFGPGPWGAAELRALYLNRMYEPLAQLFAGRDPVADVRGALGRLGFSIDGIALDVEDRPEKYPGAFCFPVQTPGDVRVSVKPASPHHLADMLFHEFGHAVHFAGIDPALPFADRHWIHSGNHETFSTLFEALLSLPEFLGEALGFGAQDVRRLVQFDRFKFLLTAAWGAAGGAAACAAWLEDLPWPEVEQRFAFYASRFLGVDFSPGYARLHAFVNDVEPYPLGYLIAVLRVAHWLGELEAAHGPRWWAEPAAGASIRARMRLGGAARFPEEWLDMQPFLARWAL